MKTNTLKCSVIALVPAAMLALVSCSSNSSTPAGLTSSSAVYQPGVPGCVMVDSYKMTATVTGIDADIYVVPRRRAPEFTTDFTDSKDSPIRVIRVIRGQKCSCGTGVCLIQSRYET